MTMAVSRAQEFVADRTAANVAGVLPARSALRKVAELSPAFTGYIHHEFLPVLQAGYLPPINDGFRRFINSPVIKEQIQKLEREHDKNPPAGIYDTHPPMAERITALGGSIEDDTDLDRAAAPFFPMGSRSLRSCSSTA
jgi:Zn-dependent protease with chaperone function